MIIKDQVFKIDDIDANQILVSRKKTSATKKSLKYFLGNDDIRLLCIKFPQIIGYVKYFDRNKTMSFKVSDKKLLKKYTKIHQDTKMVSTPSTPRW